MTVSAIAQLDTPDDLKMTLTVTMTLGEWKRALQRINRDLSTVALISVIRGAVDKASQAYEECVEIGIPK